MKKNITVIFMLLRLKINRMMMYRPDFFTAFFGDGMLFIMQVLTFEVIYSQVESVGGWPRGYMIIYIGTFSILNAINMMVYFFGIVDLPDMIRRGDLDHYLTKPVNPILRLTFENADPGSIPLVILSVLIVLYGVNIAGINISIGLALCYTVLVLLMSVLYYDMELILRSVPFFLPSMNGIMGLEDQLLNMNFNIPGILYKGIWKVVFYVIFPYAVMATVPTQLLTQSATPMGLAYGVICAIAFTVFALWFWRFGLKHYKSASS